MVLNRRLSLSQHKSHLLLGPRRVGKSTYLKQQYRSAEWIDLLKTDLFFEYRSRPALLRERYSESKTTPLIVIDEVQLIPELMHEVHWMLENSKTRFILSGSSARKLRKFGVTNLAGRLSSTRMHPLTYLELLEFKLLDRVQFGCLPPVVFSDEPQQTLYDYCGEYLKEEIQSEGLVRNLPAFSRFLELSALSNGELISYTTIARDCGVALKTIKDYFQILEDTLIGHFLPPWTKTKKRRSILTPKFYFFDCGIPNTLLRRKLSPKTPEFGKSFEQLMILEVIASKSYEKKIQSLTFWKSAGGYEVDLLIDDHTAIEFKSRDANLSDAKGLLTLSEEIKLKNKWIVSTDKNQRNLDKGVTVLPWELFLKRVAQNDF